MAHTLTSPFDFRPAYHRNRARRRRRDPRWLAIALGLALIGAAAWLGSPRVLEAYEEARSEATQEAAENAAPAELPREWRWEKKAVSFEHMYRSRER